MPPGGKKLVVLGGFGGAVLAASAALLIARYSGRLLDNVHAEEILGVPVLHDLRRNRSLSGDPLAALEELPARLVPVVDQVCVRAEAAASMSQSLTLAVVGAQEDSGTTTLALALAGRYALQGSIVIVVDAHSE